MCNALIALQLLLDEPDAASRASALLARHEPRALAACDLTMLVATAFVSDAEAKRINAAFALAGCALRRHDRPTLEHASDVANAIPELLFAPTEEVWVVAVDTLDRPVARARVAQGRVNACAVLPAEVLMPVIAARAVGFWLVHNHPSGEATPSREDMIVSERIEAAASLVGVHMIDHIVVAGDAWASCVLRGGVIKRGRTAAGSLLRPSDGAVSVGPQSAPSRNARSPRRRAQRRARAPPAHTSERPGSS